MNKEFVSTYRQVGDFKVVNVNGNLQKTGGNVAGYFRTPEGQVIHAIAGPAKPDQFLAEARWALNLWRQGRSLEQQELKKKVAQAHRAAKSQTPNAVAVHQIMAQQPLASIDQIYETVFEGILGEKVRKDNSKLDVARIGLKAARGRNLPLLFLLHNMRDNEAVERQWQAHLVHLAANRSAIPFFTSHFLVIGLPIRELPALSTELGAPPYKTQGTQELQVIVTDSNGNQIGHGCSFKNTNELVGFMARGLAVEAAGNNNTATVFQSTLRQIASARCQIPKLFSTELLGDGSQELDNRLDKALGLIELRLLQRMALANKHGAAVTKRIVSLIKQKSAVNLSIRRKKGKPA
jgi:hypothetical protein